MKVLIIDEVHEVLTNGLRQMRVEVDYQPHIHPQEVIEIIHEYDGLVVRTKMFVDENVLSKAVKLKFIGRAGAGLDNIDVKFCEQQNISCFNAGEANADAVGEHTLAMLLSICTGLQKANAEVRNGIWDRKSNTGWELKGKTVGLIGFGNTGKAVAQKLSGFGVSVLAFDKYLSNYGNAFAIQADMQEIFDQADIVSLHIPLTTETQNMVNEDWVARFKKPFVLLNLARGPVMNLSDVLQACKKQQIIGLGLDVLPNENIHTLNPDEQVSFENLLQVPHTVLSPHVAGWTRESYVKIAEVLLQKIKELTVR